MKGDTICLSRSHYEARLILNRGLNRGLNREVTIMSDDHCHSNSKSFPLSSDALYREEHRGVYFTRRGYDGF